MKYKLEVYGWSMEAMGHSLNDQQLEDVDILMRDNNCDELWQIRSELEDVVDDMWGPDLFHMNAPFYNGSMFFRVLDENEKVVLEFNEEDLGDIYENVEDVDNKSINVDWKTFEMKSNKGQKRYGVIAQELEEVHPEFVRTDDEGMKSVAYTDLLIAKIAELEARLAKLENK